MYGHTDQHGATIVNPRPVDRQPILTADVSVSESKQPWESTYLWVEMPSGLELLPCRLRSERDAADQSSRSRPCGSRDT